jgi:hypothetical protein
MEDKRVIKRERSPFTEGSPLPGDVKTLLYVPSGSPSPQGSPSKVTSRCPCSLVFEQDDTSRKTHMIDLSSFSDEENFIVDTSRDVELTKKHFGDLNRNILGPPGNSKIIVLDNSDDETEALEEKTTGIDPTIATASVDPASSAPTSADDVLAGAKIGNSDDQGFD